MSGLLKEYYVVKRGVTRNTWKVLKYTEGREPSAEGLVTRYNDGSFFSDDAGFMSHMNERANKRIRIVKEHLQLYEPKYTSYWLEGGRIYHHTLDL